MACTKYLGSLLLALVQESSTFLNLTCLSRIQQFPTVCQIISKAWECRGGLSTPAWHSQHAYRVAELPQIPRLSSEDRKQCNDRDSTWQGKRFLDQIWV
ncbi:hypothetical protein IG631_08206 [Alternaria alternata]|nr:hypothetical protein IG631_08206 [Alternaria alternata]